MYEYLFFDLDGTVTDPGEGITNSVMYALGKFGIKVEDRSVLYPFIGPPLIESFEKYYGFSPEDAGRGVDMYREYYSVRGIFENRLYDGIERVFRKQKERGKHIVLATLKPEPYAIKILEHFGVSGYFDLVSAAYLGHSRETKGDIIRNAMSSLGISDPSSVLMIGDRENDITGAKENGVDSVGVLYGYGGYDELKNAGATYIVKTPEELLKF